MGYPSRGQSATEGSERFAIASPHTAGGSQPSRVSRRRGKQRPQPAGLTPTPTHTAQSFAKYSQFQMQLGHQ